MTNKVEEKEESGGFGSCLWQEGDPVSFASKNRKELCTNREGISGNCFRVYKVPQFCTWITGASSKTIWRKSRDNEKNRKK
ncbi:hypothetical protein NPIL_527591 [Nephila pilipes]|uniref:Uncharacterized protein n=1 Tax=Nephila pilipes TaxID=299642 RepID=A0A8X6NUC9_NEPPI|nr:hypothetical protein NPIL_527591 [Nephila pilipes]